MLRLLRRYVSASFLYQYEANSMTRHRPIGNCSVMKGSRMRCKEHGRFDIITEFLDHESFIMNASNF